MASNPSFIPRPDKVFGQTLRPRDELARSDLFDLSGSHANYLGPVLNDNGADLAGTAAAAKTLVRQYWIHLPQAVRDGLLTQLTRLFSPEEWDEDDCLPSLDSFRTLLRAIVQVQPKKRPYLGLSERGSFLGGWSQGRGKLVIDARPNDRISWIVTIPDGEEINRASGTTNVKEINTIIDAHHGREVVDGN